MMKTFLCFSVILMVRGFTPLLSESRKHLLFMSHEEGDLFLSRRLLISSIALTSPFIFKPHPALAVERAVGSAEQACREAGNCLERFELDGAVGWNWGGKERCDATDPRCGSDGVLMDRPPEGEPVPEIVAKITHIAIMTLTIGKKEEGTLKMGLYGEASPKSVQQLVDFLSSQGLVTAEREFGFVTRAVSLSTGGSMTGISPNEKLSFGISSQQQAYARSVGRASNRDDFMPQPRPKELLGSEGYARAHNVAGLISIPKDGIGYAGGGSDDEAFANGKDIRFLSKPETPTDKLRDTAFQITAKPMPSMDKEGRKVIGQVMDQPSMAFLARLAKLPTNKGLKGVIPGLNFGPPLLKVSVTDIDVKSVAASSESS